MTQDVMNLTGAWFGSFSYLGGGQPEVTFIANLEEVAGLVTGTISEPNSVGDTTVNLHAIVRGSRDANDVAFTKAYDGASDAAHAVDYRGTVDVDGKRVSGFWELAGASGGFEMRRELVEAAEELELVASADAEFGSLMGR